MDMKKELLAFIDNAEACAKQSEKAMQDAIEVENYTKAQEMKVCASMHGMYAFRMRRIAEGHPAFEKMTSTVNDLPDTDDALEVTQRILNEQKGKS